MNIHEFISRYKSKSTKRNYRIILNTFFKIVDSKPETYFKENRDYEKEIESFFQNLMKNNYAPKTISSDLGCLKIYFAYNRIDSPSIICLD
jgi:site-specific recombinase XerD